MHNKKTAVLLLALLACAVLLGGCGQLASPDPTPEPTPEIYRGEPEMDFTGVSYEELCQQFPELTELRTAHIPEDTLNAE